MKQSELKAENIEAVTVTASTLMVENSSLVERQGDEQSDDMLNSLERIDKNTSILPVLLKKWPLAEAVSAANQQSSDARVKRKLPPRDPVTGRFISYKAAAEQQAEPRKNTRGGSAAAIATTVPVTVRERSEKSSSTATRESVSSTDSKTDNKTDSAVVVRDIATSAASETKPVPKVEVTEQAEAQPEHKSSPEKPQKDSKPKPEQTTAQADSGAQPQPQPIAEEREKAQSESSAEQAQQNRREEQRNKSFFDSIKSLAAKGYAVATGQTEKLKENQELNDAVGSAAGGALWGAATEVSELASNAKDSTLLQKGWDAGKKGWNKLRGVEEPEPADETPQNNPPSSSGGPMRDPETGRFLSKEQRKQYEEQARAEAEARKAAEQAKPADSQPEPISESSGVNSESTVINQPDSASTTADSPKPADSQPEPISESSGVNSESTVINQPDSASTTADSPKPADSQPEPISESSGVNSESTVINQPDSASTTADSPKPADSQPDPIPVQITEPAPVISETSPVAEMEQDELIEGNELIAEALSDTEKENEKRHKETITALGRVRGGAGGGESSFIDTVTDWFMPDGDTDSEGRNNRNRNGRNRGGRRGFFSKVAGKGKDALKGAGSFLADKGGKAFNFIKGAGGRVAAPVAALMAGGAKYAEVKDNESLSGGQKAVQVGATTAGSLGGAAAGAAAGAALGSVIPIIGTAIGGLLGAVIGGIGGEKLGEMAGEAISDKMSPADLEAKQVESSEKSEFEDVSTEELERKRFALNEQIAVGDQTAKALLFEGDAPAYELAKQNSLVLKKKRRTVDEEIQKRKELEESKKLKVNGKSLEENSLNELYSQESALEEQFFNQSDEARKLLQNGDMEAYKVAVEKANELAQQSTQITNELHRRTGTTEEKQTEAATPLTVTPGSESTTVTATAERIDTKKPEAPLPIKTGKESTGMGTHNPRTHRTKTICYRRKQISEGNYKGDG